MGLNEGEQAPTREERTWAMWSHLGALVGYLVPFGHLVFPLCVGLVQKSGYVRCHARESFNFQLSVSLLILVCGTLWGVVAEQVFWLSLDVAPESAMDHGWVFCGVVGGVVIFTQSLLWVVDGARRARSGARYEYPLAMRFWKGADASGRR